MLECFHSFLKVLIEQPNWRYSNILVKRILENYWVNIFFSVYRNASSGNKSSIKAPELLMCKKVCKKKKKRVVGLRGFELTGNEYSY